MKKTTSNDPNKSIATLHNTRPIHVINLKRFVLFSFMIHHYYGISFVNLHMQSDLFLTQILFNGSVYLQNQHVLSCENDVKHAKTSSFDKSNTLTFQHYSMSLCCVIYFHANYLSRKQMGVISLFCVLLLTFTRLNVATRFWKTPARKSDLF